ncbi:MAG: Rieske 2Fe-2S domain-containing protein [Myxococcota bacterium]
MSHGYVPVQWNARKKAFDYFVLAGVLAYVGVFVGLSIAIHGANAPSEDIVLIRATGSAAFVLLHGVLAIGPLARLDRRFTPLLYNRRHLGVTVFLLGFVHATLTSLVYFGFAESDPLWNILENRAPEVQGIFPYFGLAAFLILFLMAATSHDFWQALLGNIPWKWLHMAVYLAYVLLVLHVAYGVMRSETDLWAPTLVGLGILGLSALHLAAARVSTRGDALLETKSEDEGVWVDAGAPESIALERAKGVRLPSGERIAVVHHREGYSALSGVCAHQAGPLYEGRVIDDCLTCPWHGYQYRPENGQSPPPFEERLPTYRLRLRSGRLQVLDQPQPPGTPIPPLVMESEHV